LFYGIQTATSSHIQLIHEITLDVQDPIYTHQALSEAYTYRFSSLKDTGLVEATYQSKLGLHLKLLQH